MSYYPKSSIELFNNPDWGRKKLPPCKCGSGLEPEARFRQWGELKLFEKMACDECCEDYEPQ